MSGKRLLDLISISRAATSIAKKALDIHVQELSSISQPFRRPWPSNNNNRESEQSKRLQQRQANEPKIVYDVSTVDSNQRSTDNAFQSPITPRDPVSAIVDSSVTSPPVQTNSASSPEPRSSVPYDIKVQDGIPSVQTLAERNQRPEELDVALPTASPADGNTKLRSAPVVRVQHAIPNVQTLAEGEHLPGEIYSQPVESQSGSTEDRPFSSSTVRILKSIPNVQILAEQDQLPEEVCSELFHSPRAAAMFPHRQNKKPAWSNVQFKAPADRSLDIKQSAETLSPESETAASTLKGTEEAAGELNTTEKENVSECGAKPMSNTTETIPKPQLDSPYELRESRVPSSRLGRLWQYGGLATSLAFGAAGEGLRRSVRASPDESRSLFLTDSNMKTLVSRLSRMRGAALKLGQMISFQDLKVLPGPIQEVLQRVQDSADFMPMWQRNKILANNLGSDWKDTFSEFEDVPIAAASIGQVHKAKLKADGMPVAVKIQYPGVADSIDSDLNNLSVLLTASRLLPKGLYLDRTIANARTELAWECDYVREGEAARRFAKLLADDTDTFCVPKIVDFASTSQVLTMEFMSGLAVTKIQDLHPDKRDWIATHVLRLCLREVFEFKYMQTDPNWTNFLFNHSSNKIELLDFGASREFPVEFIDPYLHILLSAARGDRQSIVDHSVELGYLTGHESRVMRDAHVDSILTLAEPFADTAPDVYDFRDQTITDRVRALIPVMLRERLSPPPEETYSLHRKLSGAFLLCARLRSRVPAKALFQNAVTRWNNFG